MAIFAQGKYENKRPVSVPLILLSLAFLGVAIFSGYKVISILREYDEGEKTYEALQQHIQLPAPTAPPAQNEKPQPDDSPSATFPKDPDGLTPETEPFVSPVDFEALWEINPDVVGWIYIEGTNINYPIVQGETNNTYLHHLINGKYNASGSIFMDFRNNPDYTDRNTVLYGHHMGDGSMFAHITKYQRQSYYEAHPTGYLFTPERTYELIFFSGYVTDMRGNAWQMTFPSAQDYAQWLQDTASRSLFSCGILPTVSDQVLTLSTCTYEYDGARFVLSAIMR